MKLIITRHGQTVGNVKRLLAGLNDKLTSTGISQAKKLSMRLKDEKIDAIYTSPLDRAKKTAEIIASHHPGSDFIIANELREMELGSYLNKNYDKVDWENMPKDVESRTSMFKRAKSIVQKAMKKYPDGTVLFVSHNAMSKALIRYINDWDPEDRRSISQGNAALTICDINQKEKKILLFNDIRHLKS